MSIIGLNKNRKLENLAERINEVAELYNNLFPERGLSFEQAKSLVQSHLKETEVTEGQFLAVMDLLKIPYWRAVVAQDANETGEE